MCGIEKGDWQNERKPSVSVAMCCSGLTSSNSDGIKKSAPVTSQGPSTEIQYELFVEIRADIRINKRAIQMDDSFI